MKSKIIFAMLIAVGILLAACSDDNITYVSDGVKSSYEKANFGNIAKNQQDTNLIMPLNVGNYWVYNVTYCQDGIVCSLYYELLAVVGIEDISGETWYKMQSTTDYGYNKFFYYINTSQGLFCKLTKDSEPVLLCPSISLECGNIQESRNILLPKFNANREQIDFISIKKADVGYSKYVHSTPSAFLIFPMPNATLHIKRAVYVSTSGYDINKYIFGHEEYAVGIGMYSTDYLPLISEAPEKSHGTRKFLVEYHLNSQEN